MKEVKAKLTETIKRTQDAQSFRFLSETRIEFIPGQFLQIIFDENNLNNKELNKYLSFSSSPTKEYIEFTKRLSESLFSQKLKNLNINDKVLFKAPLGSCILKDEYKKIAFLIGGIGITPVISIIEYVIDKRLSTDIVLLYSNRTEAEIAFRQELDYWQSITKNIKVIYTLTDSSPKDARYVFGRIDKDLLIKKILDLDERIFFIFGPPKMVEAMKGLCIEVGCKNENIKTESFIGY